MNNNDLIRREDVFRELDSFLAEAEEKMLLVLEQYGACANRAVTNCEETARGAVNNIRKRINAIPAAPQPMSAVEYERILRRFWDWCASRLCSECDLFADCPNKSLADKKTTPEERVETVQKWAKEHPEEVEE